MDALSSDFMDNQTEFATKILNASSFIEYFMYYLNGLSASQTSSIVSGIMSSASVTSLTSINLEYADWSDDSACDALAQMINNALNLSMLFIEF